MARSEFSFETKLKQISLPWVFDRRDNRHVVISADPSAVSITENALSSAIVRILTNYSAGSVRFLFIDPVGLGKNFAHFHALSDYFEDLISGKVWSDRKHIAEQMDKIVLHIEGVVQKYLRSNFDTIEEYNSQAGEIAEPYRFIFIYGFPENFDRESCLSLERIMENGARCGVHVFLVWDSGKELPHGVSERQILLSADHYQTSGGRLISTGESKNNRGALTFQLGMPPDPEIVESIVKRHGHSAADGSRVEVPYDSLMSRVYEGDHGPLAAAHDVWGMTNDKQLVAPIGPSGARSIQQIILGAEGTAHHVLVVGRTGSGKSNLLHVFVLSLAELYRPEEVEIYLIDFKEGVEFKDYADHKLPHARVVAIESEQEFGLSVLRGMDAELTRRGELFRSAGVSNLSDYLKETSERMPRIVLVVDEFHELISDEGSDAREALSILDRMVRQGRGFGMHLVLASQSLAGVHLPRSILDQIGVRIAMQCSDADSRLVLAEDNGAARTLVRAGQAIFNDKNGLVEGNNTFQVAYLSPEVRKDRLVALRERAVREYPESSPFVEGPYVFEGSEPADFPACKPFKQALENWPPFGPNGSLNLWVGEPIAMLPAHAVELKRQSGGNLVVIDRDEALGFGVMMSSVLSVVAQATPESARFHFIDLSAADAAWADHPEDFDDSFPHPSEVYGRRQLKTLLHDLAREVEARYTSAERSSQRIILIMFGIQRARDLRRAERLSFGVDADENDPKKDLTKILTEGPEVGVHTLIWCDTVQNLMRILDNAAFEEVGHRISGELNESDSIKLFDDRVASKITRPNRMICYDDEKVGVHIPIRPYLPCDADWMVSLGQDFRAKWKVVRE